MERAVRIFDWLEERWEGPGMRRLVSRALVAIFLAALAVVEAARLGLLPARVAAAVPASPFMAIELAFYLLLSYEVIGLVFGLSHSVSSAAGKQIEIFSLILLRHSFELFSGLEQRSLWPQARDLALEMLSDAGGALAIFVALGFYYRLQRHRAAPGSPGDRERFIAAKKVIALALLAVFGALAGRSVLSHLLFRGGYDFFAPFYTLLVFADILVVLISLRYSSTYQVVFRNSGLAVATVLLRLALSAPPFVNAILGLAAAVFAVALTMAFNAFAAPVPAGGGAPPTP